MKKPPRESAAVQLSEINLPYRTFFYTGHMQTLDTMTKTLHAKEKQKESRAAALKRGRGSRLEQKKKARTAEKPWGGKRAR